MSDFSHVLNRLFFALLRIFFYLLYHQFAWTYDWVADLVSLGRWKDWLLTTLPYFDGSRVLELGHGPGHLQTAVREKGICSIGIDESRQMGKLAVSRLKNSNFVPLIVRGYAQSLPFADMSFHQVLATFPTEYIAAPETLFEILRVLIPGGKLIILPVAWITGSFWPDRLAAWLFRVTGQAPEWDERLEKRFLDPFITAGFQVEVKHHEIKSSQVLIILAEKAQTML